MLLTFFLQNSEDSSLPGEYRRHSQALHVLLHSSQHAFAR
jgi:hypothetical protein